MADLPTKTAKELEKESLDLIINNNFSNPLPQSIISMEVINSVCELLKYGYSIRTVCGMIGISEATYQKWKKRGYKDMKAREEQIENGMPPEHIPLTLESHMVLKIDKNNALYDKQLFDSVNSEAMIDGKFALDILKTRKSSGLSEADKPSNQSINLQGNNQQVVIVSPAMADSDEDFHKLVEQSNWNNE